MTNARIIASSPKIKTIEDIIENIDLIAELVKEDTERIIKKSGGFVDYNFDLYYKEAIKWTKIQIEKHNLKLYKKIFKCKKIENAIKILIKRITNNTKNQFDSSRKGTVAYFVKLSKNNIEQEVIDSMEANDPLDQLIRAEELKEASQKRKKGLEKMEKNWQKMLENGSIGGELTKHGHTQMVLIL